MIPQSLISIHPFQTLIQYSFYFPFWVLQTTSSPCVGNESRNRKPSQPLLQNQKVVQQGVQLHSQFPVIIKTMRVQQDQRISKRKYSKISLQKRIKLVRMVTEENQPATKAAKKLAIKLCTARIILKKYKLTGRFPMKNKRQQETRRDHPIPTPSDSPTSPSQPQQDPLPEQPSITSFVSPCQPAKEENIFYPYWMWYNNYYACLAAASGLPIF